MNTRAESLALAPGGAREGDADPVCAGVLTLLTMRTQPTQAAAGSAAGRTGAPSASRSPFFFKMKGRRLQRQQRQHPRFIAMPSTSVALTQTPTLLTQTRADAADANPTGFQAPPTEGIGKPRQVAIMLARPRHPLHRHPFS
jgi:hypothetical protein